MKLSLKQLFIGWKTNLLTILAERLKMSTDNDSKVIEVSDDTVFCDGGNLGHPRVFLTFEDGRVECPYCGQEFVKI